MGEVEKLLVAIEEKKIILKRSLEGGTRAEKEVPQRPTMGTSNGEPLSGARAIVFSHSISVLSSLFLLSYRPTCAGMQKTCH